MRGIKPTTLQTSRIRFVAFLLVIYILTDRVSAQSHSWPVRKVAGSIIEFSNGHRFNADLYNFKYIGQVPDGNRPPFLLFSGRDCYECDANISVYIEAPAVNTLSSKRIHNEYYAYPGRENDYENGRTVYKARTFFGEVLPGVKGVVWYQHQLMTNHRWKSSVFVVHLSAGSIRMQELKFTGQLNQTLQLVKQGRCREIKGMNYKSEP